MAIKTEVKEWGRGEAGEPFQNPHSRKPRGMRAAVLGQAHRSVKRNDSPPRVDENSIPFKSPWLRRVFKRLEKK